MGEDLKRAQLHAIQYQHIDGTFELTFGITLLLMAASFYGISRVANPTSFLAKDILPWLPLVVFAAGGFLVDALLKRFRMWVTVPRSGYIETRKPEPLKRSTRWLVWIGIPLLTIFLLAVLFLNRGQFQAESQDTVTALMPFFWGLLLSGLWVIVGWKIHLPRFYLIAAVSMAVTAVLFFARIGGNLGAAVLLGITGIALCASGGVTLANYLRTTHLPADSSPAN
jgi:hypothetical protein